jgi:lipoate-protein ligase A
LLLDAARQRLQGRAKSIVRESGGGAVLTGPWLLAVSVVLPGGHPWLAAGLLEGYRQLGQLHVAALAALGISVRALSPHVLPCAQQVIGVPPVDWACFGSLSPWEVVSADGRKLVGLAQRRKQSGVLLTAGTLLDLPDWPLLCDAMGQPQDAASLRQRTVSCAELARHGVVGPEQFVEVLAQGLEQALC